MNLSRRALEVLILQQVQDSIQPLKGRPWSPEVSGEINRRITERLIELFPDLAGSKEEQDIRRMIAEVVLSVFRQHRSKEKP